MSSSSSPTLLPLTVTIAGTLMSIYTFLFPYYLRNRNLLPFTVVGGGFFKALPIILLSRLVAVRTNKISATYPYLTFVNAISYGLLLSSVGDVSLDIEDLPDYKFLFLIGLGAFLLAHILYIQGFSSWGLNHSVFTGIMVALGPLCFLYYLIPFLDMNDETRDLILPVVVYAATIGIMVYTAIVRKDLPAYTDKMSTSKLYGIYGAVIFAVSDSILAWDKFILPIVYGKVWVMTTYYTAQTFIALSSYYLINSNEEDNTDKTPVSGSSSKISNSKKTK